MADATVTFEACVQVRKLIGSQLVLSFSVFPVDDIERMLRGEHLVIPTDTPAGGKVSVTINGSNFVVSSNKGQQTDLIPLHGVHELHGSLGEVVDDLAKRIDGDDPELAA